MGLALHETGYGHRFFGYDFPELVKSIQAIHEDNKVLVELKQTEIELKRQELALKEKELLLREKELNI
ncbi:hypothetical protein [Ornithinibacillus contaminans]|uniref:hypothetical protein n=1 Tax=Ornithinibacillus contaminans TaxID=694055 RepID=UPI00064DA0F4|nr:hypothetical protein [Ornithinibacillus contaminans]